MLKLKWWMFLVALVIAEGSSGKSSACTEPTSSSLEVELEIEFEDYDLSRDRLLYKIELESEVAAPSQTAQCQCGLGLGTTTFLAPDSFNVVTAAVGVRNDDGLEFDLEDFEGFASDGSVTTMLNGLPGFNAGATPFGLSTNVNPFTLPALNPGDRFVLGFLVEFALDDFDQVNGQAIQFAAGSNDPTHPLTLFSGYQSTLSLPQYQLDPSDVNFDEVVNVDDLDEIFSLGPIDVGVPATSATAAHDLDEDGTIDMNDVEEWLEKASRFNGLSEPYMFGDANVDGVVDGKDFLLWNSNKFSKELLWSSGNFNGDAFVDGSDFVAWNANKFTSSAVPEPSILGFMLLGMLAIVRRV